MKKGMMLTMAVGGFFAFTTIGCGEKFTPLSAEQMTAQVDSLYKAQEAAKLEELRAACASGLQAQVDAKVEALKAESQATAAK